MRIEKRIIIGWSVSLLIVLIFSSLLFYSKLKLQQSSSEVEQNYELLSATQKFLSLIQKQEIISKRFALTKSQTDFANYNTGLDSLQKNLITLEELVKKVPILKESFYPIQRIIQNELFMLNRFNLKKRSSKNIDLGRMAAEENIYLKLYNYMNILKVEEEKLTNEQVQLFNSKVDRNINHFMILVAIYSISLSSLFVFIIYDIRKRKILLHEISQSRKELETIINTAPAMIWVKNVDKKYTLLNKSYAETFSIDTKLSREEIASCANKIISVHPNRPQIDKEDSAIIENRAPLINIERKVTLENGKSIYLNVNRAPMFDENNNLVGIVGVMDDITTRVESEKALLDTKKTLEESNKQKDKLFSIIAHDLRSPFNGMLGFIEILSEEYPDLSEEEKISFIKNIQTSLKDLLALIDNLLTWARSNLNREDYNPRDISMSEIINPVMRSYSIVAANKKINIHSSVEENLVLFADPDMLETVIRNLVSNAIKFTRPGGKISINGYQKDQLIIVEVADEGVGMSQEVANNLFKLDANVTSRGTNNEKGTGLGLIICKNFVEKHGGTIFVKSELNKGTVVSFNLPLNHDK
jgi:PAS domain S-box-containing protein